MKPFGKLLTKFNLEKPGKWPFSPNHATIKTWKNLEIDKNDLENNLEKPGVGPFRESGDPEKVRKNVLVWSEKILEKSSKS